jgi:hypothetical protein
MGRLVCLSDLESMCKSSGVTVNLKVLDGIEWVELWFRGALIACDDSPYKARDFMRGWWSALFATGSIEAAVSHG